MSESNEVLKKRIKPTEAGGYVKEAQEPTERAPKANAGIIGATKQSSMELQPKV